MMNTGGRKGQVKTRRAVLGFLALFAPAAAQRDSGAIVDRWALIAAEATNAALNVID